MADVSLRLDHLNMPARDPEGLARWYEQRFGLKAERHVVRGPGVLIVFQAGDPVNRAPEFHIGMRASSMAALKEWATKFDMEIKPGSEFNSFRTSDPEGNCIEIYCPAQS